MKKMILSAVILLVATFLLPSLAFATPTSAPSGITSSHRAPPGHILSPDLANDSSQNPQPDLGQPNYKDWAFYALGAGQGGYTGVYATLYPQPVHFDHDWWTTTQEYWVDVVVTWEGNYYAEIG